MTPVDRNQVDRSWEPFRKVPPRDELEKWEQYKKRRS